MQYEERVLSILLRHPEEILKVELAPDDFETDACIELFAILQSLAAAGDKIDLFMVGDRLKSPEGLRWLVHIRDDYPSAVENLPAYAASVKSIAKTERLKAVLSGTLNECQDNKTEVDGIIGNLISTLSGFSKADTAKVFDGKSMMRETIDYLDEVFDLKAEGKLVGVPSGMRKLDGLLGGFHKSDLIVVGARPGMGKTAWALTCAVNAAQKGYKVGFISTEMSVVQVGMRITSLVSGIPAYKMRDSSFDELEWPRLTAAAQTISTLPLFIYDQPSCKVSDIAIQARAWAMTTGLDIIFVDYLTRLKPESNSENRTLAVGDLATGLKTLARNFNIPVVALAQLSREVTKRKNAVPQSSDLRDSGVIEQEADQILMLYRGTIYDETARESDANIIVDKNRHGDVAMLNMEFRKEVMRWCDPDYEYSDYDD